MSKDLNLCIFLDFYGSLLTERQQYIMNLYYNEDFSLAEISEEVGITRQGVRDAIKKAEKIIYDTEEKLKLGARFNFITNQINTIENIITGIAEDAPQDIKDKLKETLGLIETIRE